MYRGANGLKLLAEPSIDVGEEYPDEMTKRPFGYDDFEANRTA